MRWKLEIPSFQSIHVRPRDSFRRERMTCLKSRLKAIRKQRKMKKEHFSYDL